MWNYITNPVTLLLVLALTICVTYIYYQKKNSADFTIFIIYVISNAVLVGLISWLRQTEKLMQKIPAENFGEMVGKASIIFPALLVLYSACVTIYILLCWIKQNELDDYYSELAIVFAKATLVAIISAILIGGASYLDVLRGRLSLGELFSFTLYVSLVLGGGYFTSKMCTQMDD